MMHTALLAAAAPHAGHIPYRVAAVVPAVLAVVVLALAVKVLGKIFGPRKKPGGTRTPNSYASTRK